ncbi:ribokinase [Persicitalea jodogahamensis]|uniref:Ribokinase n=1 Tax=Persicitalea jodogahamensis TaxID=402147 RepID=A0A8J3G7T2_9BACT|nr:ribokinase [Persicitalea jodogahamensis]GHB52727.1 ribokinase [Persicitalea jodogahamensis]
MSQIIVIGSSNTDMVVKAAQLPGPGETVLGGTFLMNSGGKGANQAMAAQRLQTGGGQVVFIAKVGNDVFGREAIQAFEKAGLDTRFILQDRQAPSGVALIGVDDEGENSIMVAPGANANLSAGEVSDALGEMPDAEWVMLQLEIPLDTVKSAIAECTRKGLKVVLNPAPAQRLDDEFLKNIHLIIPNETEAELLTGISITDTNTVREAASILHKKGVENVVITLGAKGAFLYNATTDLLVLAPMVEAIDTTAAGDVFCGALVVALSEGKSLADGAAFACQAAALSVARMGAQPSIPSREEVETAMG